MSGRAPRPLSRERTDVSAQHTHEPVYTYWARTHSEHVVLNIGGNCGALVLYTRPEFHGREIEVSPLGLDAERVHTAVLERHVNGRTIFAAVYPELRAGHYRIWSEASSPVHTVTIGAGRVAEVDWR